MDQEFNALLHNDTWKLVLDEPHMNVVGCKWVFRTKRNADGSIEQYKARLVAKGFNQVAGDDFFDTFSLVVKPTTVRLLFSLVVSHNWTLRQLDVHNAFLNGHLAETVYMKQPPGFLILQDGCFPIPLLCWHIPGIPACRRYMKDILNRAGMSDCKPLATPAAITQPVSPSDQPYDNPTQYRRLVGALQYLTITRPDLSYAVNRMCQSMHSPTNDHWGLLKRVVRYIKGTLDYGLRLSVSASSAIHAFSDSDWAGCPADMKSTSGYDVF
ncbi:PREDICTED: uncharacterized protein LOC109152551 [Ipomoea nil]|uniref:uncharacterized protein LOC109152551 n=1 Tax=Ipomoea nil TaxID=35883 RepID=UPI000900EA78|nr:PREDICTED: uncharacterized protein LOC109152551 [Ipomoea nil]